MAGKKRRVGRGPATKIGKLQKKLARQGTGKRDPKRKKKEAPKDLFTNQRGRGNS